jgi:hypothetical protein
MCFMNQGWIPKIQFYEQLNRMCIQCPLYYINIIMSDLNAKVGNESWAKTVV